MGKRKTNHHHQNQDNKKRKETTTWKNKQCPKKTNINQKKRRVPKKYWIQDAPDLIPEETEAYPTTSTSDGSFFFLLYLTKVHLYDDHPAAAAVTVTAAMKPKMTTTTTTPFQTNSAIASYGGAVLRKEEKKKNDNNNDDSTDHPKNIQDNHCHPIIYIQRAKMEEQEEEEEVSDVSNTTPSSQRQRQRHPTITSSSSTAPYVPLPHGDCGDGIINPDPMHIPDKFWAQRHRFFSKYDDGIRIDDGPESWYSVTPEIIAQHIASRMVVVSQTMMMMTGKNGIIVLDAFCGVGGNLIALAMRDEISLVIAVDTDRSKLVQAAHNCHVVYQIPIAKVRWIHGNAISILQRYQQGRKIPKQKHHPNGNPMQRNKNHDNLQSDTTTTTTTPPEGVRIYDLSNDYDNHEDFLPQTLDAIFLSPPWGGMDYESIGKRHYDLTQIQIRADDHNQTDHDTKTPSKSNDHHHHHDPESIRNGVDLLQLSTRALPSDRLNIAYYLPRNLNGIMLSQQLAMDCGIVGCVELEQNIVNHKLKTITAYIQSNNNNNNNR
jgi:trimethylguanosine synthase